MGRNRNGRRGQWEGSNLDGLFATRLGQYETVIENVLNFDCGRIERNTRSQSLLSTTTARRPYIRCYNCSVVIEWPRINSSKTN